MGMRLSPQIPMNRLIIDTNAQTVKSSLKSRPVLRGRKKRGLHHEQQSQTPSGSARQRSDAKSASTNQDMGQPENRQFQTILWFAFFGTNPIHLRYSNGDDNPIDFAGIPGKWIILRLCEDNETTAERLIIKPRLPSAWLLFPRARFFNHQAAFLFFL